MPNLQAPLWPHWYQGSSPEKIYGIQELDKLPDENKMIV